MRTALELLLWSTTFEWYSPGWWYDLWTGAPAVSPVAPPPPLAGLGLGHPLSA